MIKQGSIVVAKYKDKSFIGRVTAISYGTGRCLIVPDNPEEIGYSNVLSFIAHLDLVTPEKYPEYYL